MDEKLKTEVEKTLINAMMMVVNRVCLSTYQEESLIARMGSYEEKGDKALTRLLQDAIKLYKKNVREMARK